MIGAIIPTLTTGPAAAAVAPTCPRSGSGITSSAVATARSAVVTRGSCLGFGMVSRPPVGTPASLRVALIVSSLMTDGQELGAAARSQT